MENASQVSPRLTLPASVTGLAARRAFAETHSMSVTQLAPDIEQPSARYQHTATVLGMGSNRHVVVFGGRSRLGALAPAGLHAYNVARAAWDRPAPSGFAPSARAGHVAAAIGVDRMVVACGVGEEGMLSDAALLTIARKDVWSVEESTWRASRPTFTWTRLFTAKGETPPAGRAYAAAAACGGKLWMHGGSLVPLVRCVRVAPAAGVAPGSPRAPRALSSPRGGARVRARPVASLLDFEQFPQGWAAAGLSGALLVAEVADTSVLWREIRAEALSGGAPCARAHHALLALPHARLLLIGGHGSGEVDARALALARSDARTRHSLKGMPSLGPHALAANFARRHLADTWVLDTERLCWSELVCSGLRPAPRHSAACACQDGTRTIYVLGGQTAKPPPRFGAARATAAPPSIVVPPAAAPRDGGPAQHLADGTLHALSTDLVAWWTPAGSVGGSADDATGQRALAAGGEEAPRFSAGTLSPVGSGRLLVLGGSLVPLPLPTREAELAALSHATAEAAGRRGFADGVLVGEVSVLELSATRVHGVSPRSGSLSGGTLLTIAGERLDASGALLVRFSVLLPAAGRESAERLVEVVVPAQLQSGTQAQARVPNLSQYLCEGLVSVEVACVPPEYAQPRQYAQPAAAGHARAPAQQPPAGARGVAPREGGTPRGAQPSTPRTPRSLAAAPLAPADRAAAAAAAASAAAGAAAQRSVTEVSTPLTLDQAIAQLADERPARGAAERAPSPRAARARSDKLARAALVELLRSGHGALEFAQLPAGVRAAFNFSSDGHEFACTGESAPERCVLSGAGLERAVAGELASFCLVAHDALGRRRLHGGDAFRLAPGAADAPRDFALAVDASAVEDEGDGTYAFTYTPTRAGELDCTVQLAGAVCTQLKVVVAPGCPEASACRLDLALQPVFVAGEPITFAILAHDRFRNLTAADGAAGFTISLTPYGSAARTGADGGGGGGGGAAADGGACAGVHDLPVHQIDSIRTRLERAGRYRLDAKLRGTPIGDARAAPRVIDVVAAGAQPHRSVVDGAGAHGGASGAPLSFEVVLFDQFGNRRTRGGDNVHARLEWVTPEGLPPPPTVAITDLNSGSYRGTYETVSVGASSVNRVLKEREVSRAVPIDGDLRLFVTVNHVALRELDVHLRAPPPAASGDVLDT
jgi:hypothetical protein